MDDDVVTSFSNLQNCCGAEASDDSVFLVNFDLAYDPDTGEATLYAGNGIGSSNSNESAIIKQGRALELAIEEVLEATNEEKVVLVGHSMGGLAIREYLQRQTPSGEHRWWVEPGKPEGHRVARVVTYGTPHRGSNLGSTVQLDLCFIAGVDCDSEAVRDLRWQYITEQKGRYLYGGSEEAIEDDFLYPSFEFYNVDVNADGDESDEITGINASGSTYPWEGTYSNPDIPLPLSVPYTWITSDPRGDGDGVVSQSRQWLYSFRDGEKIAAPVLYADTLLTNRCHVDLPDLYCDEPPQLWDVSGFVRGLDEPDFWGAAYQISVNEPEGSFVDGYFTAPSGFPVSSLDLDAYRFEVDSPGSVTISVPPDSSFLLFLGENGFITGTASLPSGAPEPHRITSSVSAGFSHSAFFGKEVSHVDLRDPYSFRVDTQRLQHFSYEPRHGEFADTTEQGFASVFIPQGVPQINGSSLETGDEIGMFTPDGTCVGAAVWTGAPAFVTAFGNENGGLSPGDSIHVRLWDQESDREYFTDGKLSGNEGRYEPGAFYAAERLESSSPVLVELARFQAEPSRGLSAVLRWKTASETDNSGFDVQHQPPEEETWKTIGFVESKVSGGTTSEPMSYRFGAKGLRVGVNRFRLKYVGLDGVTSVSEPVAVELTLDSPLQLTAPVPNPVQNRATLSFAIKERGRATVRLYDMLGRRVATLFEGSPTAGKSKVLRVDASNLSSGVYVVRLKANGRARTRRVTVVR